MLGSTGRTEVVCTAATAKTTEKFDRARWRQGTSGRIRALALVRWMHARSTFLFSSPDKTQGTRIRQAPDGDTPSASARCLLRKPACRRTSSSSMTLSTSSLRKGHMRAAWGTGILSWPPSEWLILSAQQFLYFPELFRPFMYKLLPGSRSPLCGTLNAFSGGSRTVSPRRRSSGESACFDHNGSEAAPLATARNPGREGEPSVLRRSAHPKRFAGRRHYFPEQLS